jgi:hypothetical protein
MKNILRPAFLIVMILLIMQNSFGQTQKDMTAYLTQKFLRYCQAVPREEVFLHTDREEYISGEEMWFNAYVIDRQSSKVSLNSRIVYFELLNSVNRPVIQKRVLTDNGFGAGQIVLPDTLSTGTYTIRAYTNWMKNFLPYNCYVKNISVFNTLNASTFRIKKQPVLPGKETELASEGIDIEIDNTGDEFLTVTVNTDTDFRSKNSLIYIFIQTKGNINHVGSERLQNPDTKISIQKSKLTGGINQITVFNSRGEPVSEKYAYTKAENIGILNLQSADSFGLRNKITLHLEDKAKNPAKLNMTNFSISVSPLINGREPLGIDDYLIFGSEFDEFNMLTNHNIITNLKDSISEGILDGLRSNWIDWKKILSGQPELKYLPEREEHFIGGRLLTENQSTSGISEFLLMSSPGREASFQYARTDPYGNFNFKIHIDEGLKDLVIMPDSIGKNQRIIIESSFSDKYQNYGAARDSSTDYIPDYFSKLSVNNQVQKIYGIPSTGGTMSTASTAEAPLRFYGKPDMEIILADYISLPVMSEIFFELIPAVALKKKKSGYEISITNRIDNSQYTTYPTMMIDGVIIRDATYISNLDPQFVEKIDVILEKYMVGKYLFPGLINVITKAADFTSITLPGYMIRIPYRVTEPVRTFVSPDYTSDQVRESRVPDYRNTLYWNPAVKTDSNGMTGVEFWSSDNKSEYVINVQGITREGKPVSVNKIIRVK